MFAVPNAMRRYSDTSFDSDGSADISTDMECGPCGASRLSLAATWVCSTCKESFCNNCVKIHKLKKSSRNHQLLSIKNKIDDDVDNDYDDKPSDTSKYSPKRSSIVAETMHAMRQKAQDRKSEIFDRPRDQLQYMKALEKRHDHFNEDLDNEYYCEKHQEVMCILCKEVKHKNCKTFKPVEDVAGSMKSSSDTNEMVKISQGFDVVVVFVHWQFILKFRIFVHTRVKYMFLYYKRNRPFSLKGWGGGGGEGAMVFLESNVFSLCDAFENIFRDMLLRHYFYENKLKCFQKYFLCPCQRQKLFFCQFKWTVPKSILLFILNLVYKCTYIIIISYNFENKFIILYH